MSSHMHACLHQVEQPDKWSKGFVMHTYLSNIYDTASCAQTFVPHWIWMEYLIEIYFDNVRMTAEINFIDVLKKDIVNPMNFQGFL